MFTERTQVLLTPEQRARLERLAARRGVSVGALIREAIELLTAAPARPKRDALEALFALDAPVDDWEAMKGEIVEGVLR